MVLKGFVFNKFGELFNWLKSQQASVEVAFSRGNSKVFKLVEHFPVVDEMLVISIGAFDFIFYVLNLGIELFYLFPRGLADCFLAIPYAEHLYIIRGLGVDTFRHNHSRQVFYD